MNRRVGLVLLGVLLLTVLSGCASKHDDVDVLQNDSDEKIVKEYCVVEVVYGDRYILEGYETKIEDVNGVPTTQLDYDSPIFMKCSVPIGTKQTTFFSEQEYKQYLRELMGDEEIVNNDKEIE